MRTLHILATAVALLMTASAPSLAASRTHSGTDAYASGAVSTDRSGPYYYGPQGARNANVQDRAPFVEVPYNNYNYHGQNLPYPDRPYGAPDGW
jgi:hypothetical protein